MLNVENVTAMRRLQNGANGWKGIRWKQKGRKENGGSRKNGRNKVEAERMERIRWK